MTSDIADVRNWLRSQHIVVQNDWLEACLNWIIEEENGLSLRKIRECVYEQWLIADLQDIGSCCLPENASLVQKIILHENYALQIVSVQDISQSSYSQLTKLEGKENENETVSAAPHPTLQSWEMKPSRMLMLTLTDGMQILHGMEYKPIPSLHVNISPGTKVLIYGPVECRLGIILLTPEKIKILGGLVESLAEENNQKKILLRALGQEMDASDNESNSMLETRAEMENIDSGVSMNYYSNAQSQRNVQNQVPVVNRHSRQSVGSYDSVQSTSMINIQNVSTGVVELEDDDDDFLMNLDYEQLDQFVKENSAKDSFEEENISPSPTKISKTETPPSCKIQTPPPMLSQMLDWDQID